MQQLLGLIEAYGKSCRASTAPASDALYAEICQLLKLHPMSPAVSLPIDIRDTASPTVASMLAVWQGSVQSTPTLARHLPLDRDPGPAVRFAHATTHTAWVGFALGMRAAARLR